jgi:hypothetical protein
VGGIQGGEGWRGPQSGRWSIRGTGPGSPSSGRQGRRVSRSHGGRGPGFPVFALRGPFPGFSAGAAVRTLADRTSNGSTGGKTSQPTGRHEAAPGSGRPAPCVGCSDRLCSRTTPARRASMPAACPTASGLDFPDSPRCLAIDGFSEGLVSRSQVRLPARRRIAPRPVYRPLYVCASGGARVRQGVSVGAFHQISVLHTAKREDF